MKYNEADPEFLLKSNLTIDPEFLDDAATFLYETEGLVLADPEEIYDAYMEHMRFSDVNEATTIRDLSTIRDSSDEMKEKFARLYHTYDKMNVFREDEDFSDAITAFGDYAEGILTAPSTYLGILTGGLAKGTAVAGQQVAKAAIRKQLISSITKRGVLAGAATEGAIGLGQGDIQERIKVELFPEYEYDVGSVALQGGLSTLPGGIFGGLSARKGAKQAVRAERIGQIGAERVARKNSAATQAAEETIRAADDVKKRQISQILVGAGEEVRTEKLPQSEYLLTQLDDSTQIRIQAAAIELGTNLKPIKFADGTTERITETIARGIADGSISARNFDEIMTKYNLTSPQLALLFTADVSRAARTLQRASQVSRVRKMAEAIATQSGNSFDEGDLARSIRGGFSQQDLDEMGLYKNITKAFEEGFMGFEQMRRGLMTTQLQTTQRNIAGGGMRVFIDEIENLFTAGSRQIGEALGMKPSSMTQPSKITPPSMIKYLWNQSEAELIAKAYSTALPKEATRLFAEFIDVADTQALSGVGGAMANFGRKLNFLNKHADNFYKKAIFAGQLDRLTRSKFGKSVADMLAEGEMDKITVDMYRNATQKAYELLYQKTPSTKTELGKFANAYLRLDKQAGIGMVTGLVMPFPRFIFNQLEFFAERAPIIGLAFSKGQGAAEQSVKQLSGLGMIGGFAVYRATQGPDTKWYNHTNEKGETTNLAPMLAGLTPFLYMGDVLYRSLSEKTDIPSGSKMLDDLQSVLVGEGFKTGASKTLFDRTIPEAFRAFTTGEEVSIRVAEEAGKILGDYAATLMYNLPSGLARDGYGLYNDEARMIIETNGEIRLWDAFMMRFTRGLPAFVRDPILEYYDPNIEIRSRPVIEKSADTKTQIPLSTSVTGLNIQAPESAMEKEFNRLGLTTYDVYKPHPFGPADVMLRDRLGDKLNEEAQAVMNTDLYKQYEDSGKRRMMKNRLSAVVNSERSIVFDQLRERVRTGQEKRFSEEDLEKFKFESTGTSDDRRQAKAEFRKKYEKDREYDFAAPGDYAKLNDELDALIKELDAVRKAYGGLVQKFNVGGMPTPMDEQMDALSLSETLEEQQAPDVSVGEYIGMLGDLRRGITGGAMTGQADMVKFIDDAIDYVKGQDADLDAPLTQLTDATLGKYGREITGDSEIAQASSKLIGENLGVIESVAPGFKILGNTLPEALGIFGDAKRAQDKFKRYEEAIAQGKTPEQAYQESGGVFKHSDIGMDQTPRIEYDDSKAELLITPTGNIKTPNIVIAEELQNVSSKRLTVGDLLKYDDFFEAYPEARDIKILPFRRDRDTDYGGSFTQPTRSNPKGGISLNPKMNPQQIRSVLLHELQHYAQFADYLHRGANKNEFLPDGINQVEDALQATTDKFNSILMTSSTPDGLSIAGELKLKLKSPSKTKDVIYDVMRYVTPTGTKIEKSQSAREAVELLERYIGKDQTSELIEHAKKVKQLNEVKERAFNNYLKASGEVEARFTQSRKDMPLEERMQEVPNVSKFFDSEFPSVMSSTSKKSKTTIGASRTDKEYLEDITDNYLAELNKQNESMINLAEQLGMDDLARSIKETMRIQNETKQRLSGSVGARSEVIDSEGLFKAKQGDVRRKRIMDLRTQSRRNELPEEFGGFRLDTEVDVPGYGPGKIGQINYNKAGEPSIMVALNRDEAPIAVGMSVPEALEKGVKITKEAPVYTTPKVKVDSFADPYAEFAGLKASRDLADIDDPELVAYYKELADSDPEEYQKKVIDAYRDAWLERTGKKPNTEVTKRNTIMENAAKKVKEGELDVQEFRVIADQQKPVKIWESLPEMATFEDMFFALDAKKSKSPFIGYNKRIEDGTKLSVRLDIPAYTRFDTWVLALKGPKDVHSGMMYAPAVRLKNVDMTQTEKQLEQAMDVAAGKAKGPFAVMEGKYVEETAEDTYKLAEEALNSDEWIQVGFDPTRRGYFYDRKTMEPVLNAEEIVQVGALVLAKKAVKGDPKDFKFNKGGLMSRK